MKKAAADLAPTLPVKNIIFLNKSAFYAVFHTTCTFPGMPPKGPGVSISWKSTQEGAPVFCRNVFQYFDLPSCFL